MITPISEEVTKIDFENFGSIVYLIKLNDQNILIDTSSKENKEKLIKSLTELNISPEDVNIIILTHAHYDHIENLNLFKNAKIYANFNKSIERDHSRINLQNILPIKNQPIKEFQIYETPGHTPEDIIILYKNILFSGDVVFHNGYIGRTDFPESTPEKMKESLNLISQLNFDILCSGH
jgi:glyoxylase-like metal-dependent hydrolase (beta-lactamase superfamily II)